MGDRAGAGNFRGIVHCVCAETFLQSCIFRSAQQMPEEYTKTEMLLEYAARCAELFVLPYTASDCICSIRCSLRVFCGGLSADAATVIILLHCARLDCWKQNSAEPPWSIFFDRTRRCLGGEMANSASTTGKDIPSLCDILLHRRLRPPHSRLCYIGRCGQKQDKLP